MMASRNITNDGDHGGGCDYYLKAVGPLAVAATTRTALAVATALNSWFPNILLVGLSTMMAIATSAMPTATVMTRATMNVTMVRMSMVMPT